MSIGQELALKVAEATCKFTQAPLRYSEPTLVRKLEELGIGRPSTYAPTITTLTTERGYLVKGDKRGELRPVVNLTLKGDKISQTQWNETVGADKGKLLPTEIGMVVTDYLCDNFKEILDYGFTANVETSFLLAWLRFGEADSRHSSRMSFACLLGFASEKLIRDIRLE